MTKSNGHFTQQGVKNSFLSFPSSPASQVGVVVAVKVLAASSFPSVFHLSGGKEGCFAAGRRSNMMSPLIIIRVRVDAGRLEELETDDNLV